MNSKAVLKLAIKKVSEGEWTDCDDLLVVEEPLEIRLQHGPMARQVQENISVTMRSPGNDKELALGFLFTEGIIQHPRDIKLVIDDASGPNTILVILKEDVQPFLPNSRNFYATSSCGVCGKASIEAITSVSVFHDDTTPFEVNKELFFLLKDQLDHHQPGFETTGGAHASALFDAAGSLVSLREDVGRHNALDKLVGAAFSEHVLPLSRHILLLSGRASFELVQKAYMAGIKIIAAIGAPSSLSVQLAERHNICLIGFLKSGRLNVYSGFDRIS